MIEDRVVFRSHSVIGWEWVSSRGLDLYSFMNGRIKVLRFYLLLVFFALIESLSIMLIYIFVLCVLLTLFRKLEVKWVIIKPKGLMIQHTVLIEDTSSPVFFK